MPVDLRVLVVADDPLARGGLAALLAARRGLVVVGQTASRPPGATLLAALEAYRPDVVVWDLGWDAAALGRLAELRPAAAPIAVLLSGGDASPAALAAGHVGRQAAAAQQAGAAALLPRDVSGPRLAAALAAIAQGLVVYDPAFLPPVEAAAPPASLRWDDETGPTPPVEELTPRELEVLRLIAEGLPNKAIAQSLRISEHTVKFHVNAILGKLGVQSRTEAVVRATRAGLILL